MAIKVLYNPTMFRILSLKRRWAIFFLIIGFGGAIRFFWLSPPALPFDKPLSTILLDRQGALLGAHIASDQQWRFPPIENVPDKFATCLTQFEDKRFYEHRGVDLLAIARAIKLNLQHGKVISGGSTLTMQVIRLSRGNPQRTLLEKLKEVMLALRLELHHNKQEILKLYATHAPFGGNIVGLETASWRYFGRSPEQLSWAESATLAVLPNSPALIHPGRARLALKKKRDALLKKLRDQTYLDPLSYQLAIEEPLPDKPQALPRLAPHLLDTLSAKSRLFRKTHRFMTTLDKSLQQETSQIIRLHAEKLRLQGIYNSAALIIDNRSFTVKAYVGNARDQQTGQEGYAIDLIQRPRSTGSTLKPLLFAHMIQAGEILPETLVADVPVRYAGFRPQNYDRQYRGAVRAKEALARSLNIPAANMLSQYGVGRFQDNLKSMGMSSLHRPPKNYGLTLILGGAEGTLWDITQLYANLARLAGLPRQERMNNWLKPTLLQQQKATALKPVSLSPASAWMSLQALLEVTRPGTDGYWKKFSSSQKIAWKTGTSFGQRDAWAIGVTPSYTVGVWVGNASGAGVAELTGVKTAAPVLFDIFNRLRASSDNATDWFKKPQWAMKTIQLCKNDGYLAVNGCRSVSYDIPNGSFFDKVSPYHRRLHLDTTGRWQVHNRCEPVSKMQHRSWFILPPDQAYYYQQHHANYRNTPPFRPDCLSPGSVSSSSNPISVIYPTQGAQIYIPIKLDGKSGKVVFRAIHREPETRLFWHIDQQFMGSTQTFHQLAVWLKAGKHILTLVDEANYQQTRTFTILPTANPDTTTASLSSEIP